MRDPWLRPHSGVVRRLRHGRSWLRARRDGVEVVCGRRHAGGTLSMRADLKRCILRSSPRRRMQFSAWLFLQTFAYEGRSLQLLERRAAERGCQDRMSRTCPRGRRPATGTSACRRFEQPSRRDAIDRSGKVGDALAAARSPVRTSVPSSGRSRRRCLGVEVLDVSVAEHETRVDLHGMLDDNRRNAVTMVGELHNPVTTRLSPRPCSSSCEGGKVWNRRISPITRVAATAF